MNTIALQLFAQKIRQTRKEKIVWKENTERSNGCIHKPAIFSKEAYFLHLDSKWYDLKSSHLWREVSKSLAFGEMRS